MISETERKNRDELFRLIQENPDLPIVPMVDEEIVADTCCRRWLGGWGKAYVGEYYHGEQYIHLRCDSTPRALFDDLYEDVPNWEAYESMSDEELKAAYDDLPWIKAIIVNIDLPEV